MEFAIVAALISTALRPLVDLAMDKGLEIGRYIARNVVDKAVDKVVVNIKSDISNLRTTLSMIESVVPVAEMMQIDDAFIRDWLRELNDVGYDARDVLEDFITFSSCTITAEEAKKPVNTISSLMLSCFCGSSSDTSKLPLADLNQLAKDIKCVKDRFDEMTKNGETFTKLKSAVGRVGSERVHVDCRPIVGPSTNKQGDNLFLGREKVKEEIMEKILHLSDDNRVHVVAISGMGGIGKTTLAQSIYNDEGIKEDDYPTKNRRWLCVGEKKLCAEKVIKEIVNDQNTSGIGNLDAELKEKLKGDRFFIVLDDVWDVDDSEWSLLFNPLTHVGKGGLIIITKREKEVCHELIKIQTAYNLMPLSEEDSWLIFERCAYKYGKSDSKPDLKGIGKKIVKKLNGLPLALRVVGCSLLDKDFNTWTNFLESNEWKLTNDDKVMSALRWSYNHLQRHLKTCFTYCALFPKDHVFDKKLVVQMWMAHDLIQKEKKKRPEDVGADYFEELVNASLLQCVDGKHMMHDLIHDLALLVSNGEITHVVSNGEFATANGSLSIAQMVRHITITEDGYSEIPHLRSSKKLLTLYTTPNQIYTTEKFDYSVLDDVFKQLKSIRVLVLVSSKITDIPDCISELRHLRYLDVSVTNSWPSCRLPDSLCRLYNLQMLAVPLNAVLPRDIVNMVNLRYLRANLPTCKGVGKLTSLQELFSICVCEGDNIRELADMQLLRGELTIRGLVNVTSSEDAAGALLKKQTLMDELGLVFSSNSEKSTISHEEVLDALGCPPNLKCLSIYCYAGVKSPSWMVDGKHKFGKLQKLYLSNCSKLESLPPLGELTSLKDLYLTNVGVKRLGDGFYGEFTNGKVFFPSLEYLHFSRMDEWEEWDDIIIENSSVSFFPCLTKLAIDGCPKLVSVLRVVKNTANFMTSLSRLEISKCPQLHSLPADSLPPSLPYLEINCCPLLYEHYRDWPKFDKLQTLRLLNCSNWESLPPLGELTSLKYLYLENVGVKRLGDEFYGKITDGKVIFQSLESLSFSFMKEWEEWDDIILENSSVPFFPLLTTLEIMQCAKLVSVLPVVKNAPKFMTSLSSLRIISCPQLHSLPANFPASIRCLSIINCSSLYERCKDESGTDWHKIQHIPYKDIRPQFSSDDEINFYKSLGRL